MSTYCTGCHVSTCGCSIAHNSSALHEAGHAHRAEWSLGLVRTHRFYSGRSEDWPHVLPKTAMGSCNSIFLSRDRDTWKWKLFWKMLAVKERERVKEIRLQFLLQSSSDTGTCRGSKQVVQNYCTVSHRSSLACSLLLLFLLVSAALKESVYPNLASLQKGGLGSEQQILYK